MLQDKLASTIPAVEMMLAVTCTTQRLAARVLGKVLHYGVAVPFIVVAAASLSQLMHKREVGLGPLEDIPHMRDEPSLQFDWEDSIEISARARLALDFVALALREKRSVAVRKAPAIATRTSFTKMLTALRRRSRWPGALAAGRRSLKPGHSVAKYSRIQESKGGARREVSVIGGGSALETARRIGAKRKRRQ